MSQHVMFFAWLLLLLLQFVSNQHLINDQQVQFNSRTNSTTVKTFYPFLSQYGADPWVFKHPTSSLYYSTKSSGINIIIWRSKYLSTLYFNESKMIWTPNNATACNEIWAPELHLIEEKWYVYFAATTCDGDNAHHRMFILQNENEDPFQGEFQFLGQLTDETNKWAIDGTVFEHPKTNNLYFIWSGWEGDVDGRQILYIAHLSNPYTVDSKRVEIARPIYSWEINHTPLINEGPEVIIYNQTINLVFSASGSWTNDYCMGLITAHIDADPMNPLSWIKRSLPIIKTGNGLFGPGHGSLTSDNWFVFHTAAYDGSGWTRQIRTQPFQWNQTDGTPILGEISNPNVSIPLPQGEPQRQRYQLNSPLQDPIFNLQVNQTGLYIIDIQVRSKEHSNTATYSITINQKVIQTVDVLYSDNWSSILVLVQLQQGQNEFILTNIGSVMAEIYSIDLFLNNLP